MLTEGRPPDSSRLPAVEQHGGIRIRLQEATSADLTDYGAGPEY